MWFRPNQSLDTVSSGGGGGGGTERLRESLKNQMRRFRSSDATSPTIATSAAAVSPLASPRSPIDFCHDSSFAAQQPAANAADFIHRDDVATPAVATNEADDDRVDAGLLAVMRSPSGRKLARQLDAGGKDGKVTAVSAEKKFKSKQRTKSKLVELDKNRHQLVAGNGRKSSAPPDLDTTQIAKQQQQSAAAAGHSKHVRSHSNLNFNALLRYKLTNRVLASVDFESMRRKSVSGERFLAGLVRGRDANGAPKIGKITTPTRTSSVARSDRSIDEEQRSSSDDGDENVDVDGVDGDVDGTDHIDNAAASTTLIFQHPTTAVHSSSSSSATLVEPNRKSPSLGARVAAHFGGDSSKNSSVSSSCSASSSASGRLSKLSKVKKQHRTSRISGLYTQNSFGNLAGLRKLHLTCFAFESRLVIVGISDLCVTDLQRSLCVLIYSIHPDRPSSSGVQRQPSDRRSDQSAIGLHNLTHASSAHHHHHHHQQSGDSSAQLIGVEQQPHHHHHHHDATGLSIGGADGRDAAEQRDNGSSKQSKSAPVSVNRSESYKERLSHRRGRNTRRKTSDPSFSKSK